MKASVLPLFPDSVLELFFLGGPAHSALRLAVAFSVAFETFFRLGATERIGSAAADVLRSVFLSTKTSAHYTYKINALLLYL